MSADQALFEPIPSVSVVDAVIEQVERMILSGVLKSGSKLPSERELSDQLSVSRPKLRDAIKILEQRGLLTVKHGEGTFVSSLIGTALSPAMVDLFARHTEAFGSYLEFRKDVEGFAAYVSAQRATADDLAIIERILDDMQKAHDAGDPVRELELDVSLHAAIVDAAHNPTLSHVMASIYDLMRRGVFFGRALQESSGFSRDRLFEQHRRIAEAIIAKDPEEASAAAEDHISFVESAFREQNSEMTRSIIARKRRLLLDSSLAESHRRRRRS